MEYATGWRGAAGQVAFERVAVTIRLPVICTPKPCLHFIGIQVNLPSHVESCHKKHQHVDFNAPTLGHWGFNFGILGNARHFRYRVCRLKLAASFGLKQHRVAAGTETPGRQSAGLHAPGFMGEAHTISIHISIHQPLHLSQKLKNWSRPETKFPWQGLLHMSHGIWEVCFYSFCFQIFVRSI